LNVTNPNWEFGVNKIYSTCPNVFVGIGVNTPTHALHVAKKVKFDNTLFVQSYVGIGADADNFARLKIQNTNQPAALYIQGKNKDSYSKLIYMEYSDPTTEVLKVTNWTNGKTPYLFEVSGKMTINNGSMDILKLESNGLLHARKIKVDTQIWPDYVFENDYELMPILDVENYIKSEKHLPNVPSQEEIVRDGIDVTEMNVILMQKIEELTLYSIEQQKQIIELQKSLDKLQETQKSK